MIRIVVVFFHLTILTGCVTSNPVSDFYVDYTGGATIEELSRVFEPPATSPHILSSSDIDQDLLDLQRAGYAPVGYSNFTWAQSPSTTQLMSMATQVRADVVLYNSEYSHTEAGTQTMIGVVPGSSSTTSTSGYVSGSSYGTMSASAYGSSGYAYGTGSYSGYGSGNYYETETTTTDPQLYTYSVPYSRRVNEYAIIFLRRLYPPILGVRFAEIPDELRVELGRNTGAFVWLVIDDSPAFQANIVQGDIIISLDNAGVDSPDHLSRLLGINAGKQVKIGLIRQGVEKEVKVKLNEKSVRPPLEQDTKK